MAARRAVLRWSWRLFRREWRQQLLVLVLLTATVAASILGAVTARSLAGSADADFGSANFQLRLGRPRPGTLDHGLDQMRAWFGAIDVIGVHPVRIPGSVNTLEYRSEDPHGAFSSPRLGLRSGRYPTGDEVAVTDGVAASQHVAIGGRLKLDGVDREVVGIVEDPADLGDEFALVAPGDPLATAHTVLVRTTEDRVRSLRSVVNVDEVASRGQEESGTAAVGALGVGVVVAILVCLVAAAGFVVVAQRRLRQIGMLAAIGATERHLRLVVVTNGLVVGAVSAVVGAALALGGWVGLSPLLEGPAARRLDRFDVPVWIVLAGMALAVATATAAAWWPGRTIARVPITAALSARPPRPRRVHRSALAAVVLVAIGFACLAAGLDAKSDRATPLLILPGIAAMVIGVLLASPIALRLLAPFGRRAPVAVRIALRDLARHQARSGVALAAIALSLGLAVSTVVLASAAERPSTEGNLPGNEIIVRFGDREPVIPEVSATDLAARRRAVMRFAATLHGTVVPLEAAVTVGATETRQGAAFDPAVVLGRPHGDTIRDIAVLNVATPALLAHLGIDPADIAAETDVLTPLAGPFAIANARRRSGGTDLDHPVVQHIAGPAYTSTPSSLVTRASVARNGWKAVPTGWLVESSAPLTAAQIGDARAMAVAAGLTVETRDEQHGLTALRTWATVAGMALALAILAMTVGIIRAEATGDLRTLAAAGATAATRRTIVAATAGALAVLGVVLGTAGAYLTLVAGYLHDLHRLADAPLLDLVVTAIGVPVVATAAGWLLGGREPDAIARAALE